MTRLLRFTALCLLVLSGLTGVVQLLNLSHAAQPPREDRWKKVAEAEDRELPKTAVAHLDTIIEQAVKDKAYPEAIRAIAKKVMLECRTEGSGNADEKFKRMKAAIAAAPPEMHPAMNAILAHWWWLHGEVDLGPYADRTPTGGPPDDDMSTWDTGRYFAEADKSFARALANEKELKATPIGQYDFLIVKGSIPDKYRPTLFDFLAFEALSFYTTAEYAGAKPDDAFEMSADSPIFGPREEFLKWEPKTTDTGSQTVKAIKLYQKVLAFHKDDTDRSALLDADLHRLRFGGNKAVGDAKNARYKAALEAFIKANAGHELSAMAHYLLATLAHGDGDLVKERETASAGAKAFPESTGGKLCYNLVQSIEGKFAYIGTERVWADPLPSIRVAYKNITKVYFRVVPADYVERLRAVVARWRPERLTSDEAKALLTEKPVLEFSRNLPATADYKERTERIAAPGGLKPGFYYLLSSHSEDFGAENNSVNYAEFWVSNLALVTRQEAAPNVLAGMVLDNRSGEPIEGATVQVWTRGDLGWQPGKTGTTDKNGLYHVAAESQVPGDGPGSRLRHLVQVSYKDQQLVSSDDETTDRPDRDESSGEKVIFFTDRSLYRPGQTIHYKGIALRFSHAVNTYETMARHELEVVFADTNAKQIARQKVVTNEYGSFSGIFTAPRDRLPGQMSIYAGRGLGHLPGIASVTVEEYKRPKFKVEVEPIKEAVKLNALVKVTGRATQYNGVPVGGAKVSFRVQREVRYAHGYGCWWRPAPVLPAQEMVRGVATTEPDGRFIVPFVARPGTSSSEQDEPSFRYLVTVAVTDTTGETRTAAQRVTVGTVALRARIGSGEWLTNDKESTFSIRTTTPDDEGIRAKGHFKIHALKQPTAVVRAEPTGEDVPGVDPSEPRSWELGEVVFGREFETTGAGTTELKTKLPPGIYRAVLETKDRFGKMVTARHQFTVVDPKSNTFGPKVANFITAPLWTVEVGETFVMLWGTGYDTGRAFIEVEHRGKIVRSFWTEKNATQQVFRMPVEESMRGGFTVHVTQVRENRAYLTSKAVDVPWTNKNLTVKWERFLNKIEPGAKETFTAIISGPDGQKAVAEMVAAMYDESLDAYLPHDWIRRFDVFRQDRSRLGFEFNNQARWFSHIRGDWPWLQKEVGLTYRCWPGELCTDVLQGAFFGQDGGFGSDNPGHDGRLDAPPRMSGRPFGGRGQYFGGGYFGGGLQNLGGAFGNIGGGYSGGGFGGNPGFGGGFVGFGGGQLGRGRGDDDTPNLRPVQPVVSRPNLGTISARKNLNETAFFFPHLVSGEDGTVRMTFTMPEALTKWKFLGFAHDKTLRSGFLTDSVVTARDLMAQPNPPRFLREGDEIEFTVKVSNQSATRQKGLARVSFKDARTDKPIDTQLGLTNPDQAFDLAAGESKTLSWKVTVPDDLGPITYKAVAATDRLSDGEEAIIPVLSKRVLVMESLPLPIRGPGTKDFDFTKLRKSGDSTTIKNQSLAVQMVSQPSWYAVMALPYLMEYPYECSEQTFNRLYANALARHIANSDPKIRRVFDQWKSTPALDSPLEKNQDLKNVILEETPWVRQAQAESQARKNVGILFDDNRLEGEIERVTNKLEQSQLADGSWSWFPGGSSNDYITLYITTGYGRMRHLGVKVDTAPALRALTGLDNWALEQYAQARKHKPEENHLSPMLAFYLYGRSFFLLDRPIADEHRAATDYWLGQAKKYWPKLADRQSQAHLALALKRFGDKDTPTGIMKSIKERSKNEEELGMYWRDTELSFSWARAPIETQAMMIEGFDEVMNDAQAVEDCKVWLLKQKQTQDWKTTKATADAVYALLLRGDGLLASDPLVAVTLGNQTLKPEKVEAGTGFYEQKFLRNEIQPSMATIQVKKTDKGVSWGSVHWSYLEDISKVTPHEGTPLKLDKKLFKKTLTKSGPVIEPIKDGEALAVGDEVVVRLVLRTDRDLEYCHLKDHRGSGTEPVNVLSRYKYQDGLGYYESTKDTASHFFIDYLPKGVYVFEYPVRVQLKGQYPTGFANIECMYAPEFNSHSENINLLVK